MLFNYLSSINMLLLLNLLGELGIDEEMRSLKGWVICLSLVRPSKHLQVHCVPGKKIAK